MLEENLANYITFYFSNNVLVHQLIKPVIWYTHSASSLDIKYPVNINTCKLTFPKLLPTQTIFFNDFSWVVGAKYIYHIACCQQNLITVTHHNSHVPHKLHHINLPNLPHLVVTQSIILHAPSCPTMLYLMKITHTTLWRLPAQHTLPFTTTRLSTTQHIPYHWITSYQICQHT
jgi:hypothetical protein